MSEFTGILIDPENKTVTPVKYGDLQSIYKHLDCQMIQSIDFLNGNSIYCDEESRINTGLDEEYHVTFFKGANYGIQGKMLVVGPPDDDGENTDVTITAQQVQEQIEKFEERVD